MLDVHLYIKFHVYQRVFIKLEKIEAKTMPGYKVHS